MSAPHPIVKNRRTYSGRECQPRRARGDLVRPRREDLERTRESVQVAMQPFEVADALEETPRLSSSSRISIFQET